MAHLWANWLPHPCRIGDPLRFRAGGRIRSGPQVGKLATSPLPYRGAPPLQRGRPNQKWPTSGQIGYLTPAVSGIPAASERGAESEVAHKWANWLPHPCRIGELHRFRAGGKIGSGPQVGKLATSPLPYRLQLGRCGPATQLQPRLPHGLHCQLSSTIVRVTRTVSCSSFLSLLPQWGKSRATSTGFRALSPSD